MSEYDRILDEAAKWQAASAGDAMDWDGFTSWLEADPRHRAAYDEVALADSLVVEHRGSLRGPGAEAPAREWQFGRFKWAGGAIAAALALLLLVQLWPNTEYASYLTADTSRQVALADGSSVTLAPHSRLIVSSDGDALALSGGAFFDIRHRDNRALAISAGSIRVHDIGTRFDIQANSGLVRVGVAEGQVEVSSVTLAQPLRLEAGEHLLFDAPAKRATVSSIPVEAVGAWRNGHLTYDQAPLSLVAADLSRYAGVTIQLPDSLKDRRFSGTLASSDGRAAIRDLAQLMALELVADRSGYRLESPAR